MKKIRRKIKISLSRETLQNLTPSQLETAAGGAAARTLCIDPSCPGNTCDQGC